MKSRNFIRLTLFAAAASLASAETLIYDGAENGSFYDGSYWGGTVPSSSSDILFNDTNKEVLYNIDATSGVTINSLTDNSITNRTAGENYSPWGKNIIINIGESAFTILNDLTLASNHNYVPFSFSSSSNGVGRVDIGGNIIAKAASDGTVGESLFGNGNLLQSVTVGGNIELQNMRLRFHTQNLSVAGTLNYSGGTLNLFYGSGSGETLSYSFGGINGSNKSIQFGGNADSKHMLQNSTATITLTNSGTARFSGGLTYEAAGVAENNEFNLVMNGASSGVQYWDDTGSGMTFNNVTVKSGTLNYYSNLGTSAIYLEGGTLSPASGTNEIAILKAESIAWDAGKISFNLTEDTAASDKIVLAYALSKTSFSGAGGIREIELSADAYDIAAWIDANDNAPITYTLMEYSSTDMANSDIVFTQIDGITIDWNFGDTALTVTLGLVPEPAEAAAALGAIAAALAALRRRK